MCVPSVHQRPKASSISTLYAGSAIAFANFVIQAHGLTKMIDTEVKEIKRDVSGLFAGEAIERWTIILMLRGKELSKPTRTSIQVRDKHIEDPRGGYINHHCEPNAYIEILPDFVGADPGSQNATTLVAIVIAKKDIGKGEEITFDYETTETELMEPFRCDCHGRWISGNKKKMAGRIRKLKELDMIDLKLWKKDEVG